MKEKFPEKLSLLMLFALKTFVITFGRHLFVIKLLFVINKQFLR